MTRQNNWTTGDRELNIILFNLKEGTDRKGKVNKRTDETTAKTISQSLEIENLQIVTSYRLGQTK